MDSKTKSTLLKILSSEANAPMTKNQIKESMIIDSIDTWENRIIKQIKIIGDYMGDSEKEKFQKKSDDIFNKYNSVQKILERRERFGYFTPEDSILLEKYYIELMELNDDMNKYINHYIYKNNNVSKKRYPKNPFEAYPEDRKKKTTTKPKRMIVKKVVKKCKCK